MLRVASDAGHSMAFRHVTTADVEQAKADFREALKRYMELGHADWPAQALYKANDIVGKRLGEAEMHHIRHTNDEMHHLLKPLLKPNVDVARYVVENAHNLLAAVPEYFRQDFKRGLSHYLQEHRVQSAQ